MADQTFAVHCGFFDAINSDRTYSADEMNRPYRRIISNGVFATPQGNPSTDLQVVESSGMNIICKAGEGLFADKWFENPSSIVITVPNNTSTVPRIDSVLVQVDTRTSGRVGNIVYRTGTPASSPVPPAINQTEGVVEYRLANIRVNAGVTSIMGRYITDRRGSSDCPWVTSLIYQVDTSTLYDQWQAAYAEYFEEEKAVWDAWYAQLTEDLDVSMTLDRHVNTVTTTATTTGTIPIGLAYNHNTDILEVYINGLRAIEGTHYVVVNDDTSIQVENQLQIGQEVTFVVMRSVISGSATNIMVLLQELESQIAGVAGGTPTVVDAKADMTEHDKIYILSSDSKWYYYSATQEDWVIGGTYGGVPTDTTLTQAGMAADSKAVGDALALKADADDVTAIDDRVTGVEGDVDDNNRYIAKRYYAESGTFTVYNEESADATRCRTDVVNTSKVKKVMINVPPTLGIVSGTVLINGSWVSSSGHVLNYNGYTIVDDDVDAFRLCYRHKNNDGQALTADEINGVYLYQYIDIYERLDNLSAVKIDIGNAKTLINTGLLKPDVQIIDRYNDANVADATRVFSGTVTFENNYLTWVTPSTEVSSAFAIAPYGTTSTMVAEYVPNPNVANKLTVEFDYDFNGTGAKCYCSDYNNATKVADLESGSDKHAKLVFDVTSVKTLSISLADKANNLSKTLKIKNLLLYYGTASVQLETSETKTAPYTKMLSIGDSLTNGCLWQSYAARVVGVQRYTRAGGSGGTVSTAGTLPIYNAVQALTSDLGYDLITFWGGTNDWSQSIELGTFEDNIDANERDTTTFYGALIGCIEKLTTLYPTARIVMIGTTPRASNNGVATYHNSKNSRNLYLSDYVDAVKTVADYFGCPFLDLLNTSGINDVNISSWMQAQDNGQGQIYYLHFNNWATEKIGRRVGAFIKSLGY